MTDTEIKQQIEIKPTDTSNTFFAYGENTLRQFNCNAIFFENVGGMGIIFINDVYKLMPGKNIYITSRQNEIDRTFYKITIQGGGSICQGYYKMDAGVSEQVEAELLALSKIVPPDRRRGDKSKYMNRRKK